MRTIKVGRDYSRFPAGRYLTDGPFSGEGFRKKFLEEPLRGGEEVTVDLAGAEGYGSSFLEEAFGGLAREHGISKTMLTNCLHIISTDPNLELFVDDAREYLAEAVTKHRGAS